MIKQITFCLFLMVFCSCRKDIAVPTSNIVNPCGDTTKTFCSFPNIVEDSVSIFISNPDHGHVVMTYYDRFGNELAKVLDSSLVKGNHLFVFDCSMLSHGLNVCLIEMAGEIHVAKIFYL